MKNITLASLMVAGLIAAASSCTPVHAADDDYRREYERIYLQSVERSERAQDRYLRESNDGYDRLQREFDRETIRSNRLGQEAERQYIEQRRRERNGY